MQRSNPIAPGTVFGRLAVIGPAAPSIQVTGRVIGKKSAASLVKCSCGTEIILRNCDLRRGDTVSCGCWKRDRAIAQSAKNIKHNLSHSRTYRQWADMKSRCLDQKCRAYSNYGGRGIRVCDRWMTFANFLADMGECPPRLTLDRIENEKGYEPGNCRWANWITQASNRRNNRYVFLDGEKVTLSEAARRLNRHTTSISARATRHGITLQQAVDFYLP